MEEGNNTKNIPFEFTGRAGEYFGIWIVNILLTIVTLGFYAPWAKVRTRRYFYGNTYLDDSPFDYLANPVAILKGYGIAVVIFILYSVLVNFYPMVQPVFSLLFLFMLPWLVVRSLLFRARNTAYRNIRFSFNEAYGEAVKVFVGFAILIPFTLGLIFPYFVFRQKRFIVNNSGYGKSGFSFQGKPGGFYKVYMGMGVLMALFIALYIVLMVPLFQQMTVDAHTAGQLANNSPDEEQIEQLIFMQSIMMGSFFFIYLIVFGYLDAKISNLVWNNVEIKDNTFQSTLRARDMIWIYFSNMAAIILSLGFLAPWAKVRLARYRFSRISLLAVSNLGSFVRHEKEQVGAAGDEIGEMFDIDIGL